MSSAYTPARGIPAPELARERFELSCGATLLVSPRKGAPVTAVRAHVRGGPSLDPPGKEGLAYLVGSLADQGTQTHDEAAIAELLEPAGGNLSGDANGIGGTIAGSAWKLLADVLCEVLTTPTYPDAPVQRQKARLVTRLAVEADDPRVQASRRFRRLVYGRQHWLGRPAYGSLASIETITPGDLRRHHAWAWCGARLLIAVCGDVKPRAVREHFEKRLATLRPGEPFVPQPLDLPEPGVRVDAHTATREQVHLFLGHLGIRRADPDYEALVVMDHVLGTGPGFTNRISRKLRDELGLAYSVHAEIHGSAGLAPGTFQAYIGTSPEHAATAVAGLRSEMQRIREEPVGTEELETAQGYLLGSFALGFERASRRASYLVSAEVHGFPEDYLERLPRAFAAVTAEDVQRVARAHLYPEACCLAAGGPLTRHELEALAASARPRKPRRRP